MRAGFSHLTRQALTFLCNWSQVTSRKGLKCDKWPAFVRLCFASAPSTISCTQKTAVKCWGLHFRFSFASIRISVAKPLGFIMRFIT